jgi:hypothetical protein
MSSAKARQDAQAKAYEQHMAEQRVRQRAAANIERHGIPVAPKKLRRDTDVETSEMAATANMSGRAVQRHKVLDAYARHRAGLTADEVDYLTGDQGYWRRCSDLRNDGLIEWLIVDGSPVMRKARSGRMGRVAVITAAGLAMLGQ